ncbi:MAG: OmpA family protein [Desulfobacteraceae bacterium]|nr:OmpA family protein [Desulfobacteraceae bacterium]
MKKAFIIALVLGVLAFSFKICFASQDIKVLVKQPDIQLSYNLIEEGKVLVSTMDAQGKPIRGLKPEDFTVGRGIQKATILSAESLESVKDIPLNMVLVIDNSFSMKERQAVEPLLLALDEFLKTIRPLDNIYLVVYDDQPQATVRDIPLHTRIFNSSDISQLKNFLKESHGRGLTSKTFLYEAMLAGVDIIRQMPARDNKFMVVFSDGEDLNSAIEPATIKTEAQGIENFEVFCIDYMPGPKFDRFLTSFAKTHNGRIWKATSSSELAPIFKAFTSTLLYRYLISYSLSDPVIVEPTGFNFDILTMVDGSPVKNYVFFEAGSSEIPADYALFKDNSESGSFDETSLKNAWDKYLNILNLVGQDLARHPSARIKLTGCNAHIGIERDNLDLSRRRAETVSAYLNEYWGIDLSRMTIKARNLPQQATARDLIGARAENQRVELEYDGAAMQVDAGDKFIAEINGRYNISIRTNILLENGLREWQLTISGDDQPLKTFNSTDGIKPIYTFALNDLDMEKLVGLSTLGVTARVVDDQGVATETDTVLLPIAVTSKGWFDKLVGPPRGSVSIEPATLTIEELTTIDSSPFLNYIYFNEGASEIPAAYKLFSNQADTGSFDARSLKDTLQKHHHILNILGQRLLEHPQARIRLVGCNSNRGVERGKIDLSRSRAEAVKAYLRYIWGIDPSRMDVDARNLPEVASAASLSEGRAENQRVEIYSDTPTLLDVIKSTYVQAICNAEEIRVTPQIHSGYGIDKWSIHLTGNGKPIGSLQGRGDLEPAYSLMINDTGLNQISSSKTVTANIEVTDLKGKSLTVAADAVVQFIKREERLAQKKGYRVLEKYALILFDFNRSDIKAHNKEIVDRIVDRIKEIPTARVSITGHTDSIGNPDYNVALSIKRARAAYDQILAGGIPKGENITYAGTGPLSPLFDNELPEGRALNRTVTVTLEYETN